MCLEVVKSLLAAEEYRGAMARLYYYDEGEKPQSQIADPHLRIVDERDAQERFNV